MINDIKSIAMTQLKKIKLNLKNFDEAFDNVFSNSFTKAMTAFKQFIDTTTSSILDSDEDDDGVFADDTFDDDDDVTEPADLPNIQDAPPLAYSDKLMSGMLYGVGTKQLKDKVFSGSSKSVKGIKRRPMLLDPEPDIESDPDWEYEVEPVE